MTTTVDSIGQFLEGFAPSTLAEDWDNVGLLLGDRNARVERVLTCLTLTPDVAEEAIAEQAGLIVSHHPVFFKPVRRLTTDTIEGRMLLALSENRVAVYSPHTRYDSAAEGINRQLADALGLNEIRPIRNAADDETGLSGSGRSGDLPAPLPLAEFLALVKQSLQTDRLQYVAGTRDIGRVGVACGAAAEFLDDAVRGGCDALITGEARFHACLEARSRGTTLVLLGHYTSERPAMESLARVLSEEFPDVHVTASRVEADPVQWS